MTRTGKRSTRKRSRKISQRWSRKELNKKNIVLNREENRAKELAQYMPIKNDKVVKDSYGFIVDPSDSKWNNAKSILTNMYSQKYFNRIRNMAYHNLCKTIAPPENLSSLLGLGLKFYIQSRRPSKNFILEGTESMRRYIRI